MPWYCILGDNVKRKDMATKIKETPVLKGEVARRFLEAIRENEQKKVPKAEYQRAKEAYKRFKVIM